MDYIFLSPIVWALYRFEMLSFQFFSCSGWLPVYTPLVGVFILLFHKPVPDDKVAVINKGIFVVITHRFTTQQMEPPI